MNKTHYIKCCGLHWSSTSPSTTSALTSDNFIHLYNVFFFFLQQTSFSNIFILNLPILKGALCSFGEKKIRVLTFTILIRWYKLGDIYHFYVWLKKLFSEGNKVPWTLFEARKVAGSATYKHNETAWNCVVLEGQFVYSVYSVMKMKSLSILFVS